MASRTHPDPVSSHVLDTTTGKPASGITATMFSMQGAEWKKIKAG